jgi:hypothetical protein
MAKNRKFTKRYHQKMRTMKFTRLLTAIMICAATVERLESSYVVRLVQICIMLHVLGWMLSLMG